MNITMKKSVKAVLLSGLLFPGTGHFSLKRYQRGMLFFIPALMSLVFIINYVLNKALSIADQILQSPIPLDAEAISQMIYPANGASEVFMLNLATWIFIACWIISMIDSYRLGKVADGDK